MYSGTQFGKNTREREGEEKNIPKVIKSLLGRQERPAETERLGANYDKKKESKI